MTARAAATARRRHRRRLHRLVDLEVRRDVPAGDPGRWSTPATTTSPTGGTRSSTSSTRWACGSPTRCTRREIAYDYWTTVRTLEAIGHREAFGLNWDPSHFVWQDLDPVSFLWDFKDRIYHVDCKDAKLQVGNGRNGRLGSHLPWADPRRGWDFVSTGHGDVPWEALLPDAQHHRLRRARSRSSGRTPAWTASSAPPRRWSSSAGSPSTRPTAAFDAAFASDS